MLFAARGTSDNAAIYGRYLLETHAGVLGGLLSPSVATHYRAELDLSDTVVVSVSQSGATEEIVATQSWARAHGAATVAVANVPGSPLVEAADLALVTQAGPEVAVPATKTYSAQLVAMVALATALAPDPSALDADLDRVPGEIDRLLADRAGVDEAVEALRATDYTVVSGRGLLMGTALETALKLEETCLRPVRGYSYADLRHGPISVVTAGMTAVLVAAPDGPMLAPMTELAGDLAAPRRDGGRHRRRPGVPGGLRPARARTGVAGDTGAAGRDRPRPARRRGAWPASSGWTPTSRAGWPRSPPTDPDQQRSQPPRRREAMSSKAEKILAGLGGADNVVEIEACITRLRTEVEDPAKVDEAALKAAGAHGVVKSGSVVQVVVGPEADNLAEDIEDLM